MNWKTLSILAIVGLSSTLAGQERIGNKIVRRTISEGKELDYLDKTVTLSLRPGTKSNQLAEFLSASGAKVFSNFNKLGWGIVSIPENVDVFETIDRMKQHSIIAYAGPTTVAKTFHAPNDPAFLEQWPLKNVEAPSHDIDASTAWDISRGDPSIKIAILDSGIPLVDGNLSHPDLDDPNKFMLGEDFTLDGEGLKDLGGHGTFVAGIAGAETDNSTGIAGVAPLCKIMIVKVAGQSGVLAKWFQDGVIYAVDNGADVINYSAGQYVPDPVYQAALSYALAHNVMVTIASGNDGGDVKYPAAYSPYYGNVIAVGSTNSSDERWTYSCQGPQLTVVAPGGDAGSMVYSMTLPPKTDPRIMI